MANRNVPTNNGAGFDEPSDIYQLVPLSRFDANSFLSEEAPPQSLTQYGRISTESSHGETVEMSLSTFWKAGLGRPNPMTVMQVFIYRGPGQFWGAVILANSWQLEISILYLLYNTLLTRLCIAVEWSHYGSERKPLRVSCPKGMQRSTYFLSLPFRYSVPLSAYLLLLHWLVSQSVFLARSAAFLPSDEPIDSDSSSRACYSPWGSSSPWLQGWFLLLHLSGLGSRELPFCSHRSQHVALLLVQHATSRRETVMLRCFL